MNDRRLLAGVLSLALLLFALSSFAADTIRVIASQAPVHLNADPNSLTLATVPAGTVLEIDGRQGAWYAVWLPPAQPGGARRLGYVAASDAEVSRSENPRAEPVAAAPAREQPAPPPAFRPARLRSSGDFDGFGGVTFNLPGARAVVASSVGTADSGEHTTLPTFGFALGGWISNQRVYGVFFDLSGVDGGSATAQVGSNNHAEASYSAVDFHVGWQIQYPGRIRPYGFGGIGMDFQKSTGSITLLARQVTSIDQTDHFLSYVFGGGVRFMIGDNWGVKVGIDALSVRVTDSGYLSYGRFVAGSFYAF